MGYGASLRKSAANGKPQKVKAGNKNPDQSLQYYLSRMEHDAAKIAAIQAARIPATEQATRVAARTEEDAEDEDPSTHDVGDQRVVIKFFYDELGRPNERHWQGRYGTISRIRVRMGDCAPDMPIQNIDGSERLRLGMYPHVKILSKFEVLGPRNGRGRTSPKPLKCLDSICPTQGCTKPEGARSRSLDHPDRTPRIEPVIVL